MTTIAATIAQLFRNQGHVPLDIQELANGIASRNFRVTCADGPPLIARLDSRRPMRQILDDDLFSHPAHKAGISTSPRLLFTAATALGCLSARYYVPGETVLDLPYLRWPSLTLIGATLGSIHDSSPPATVRSYFYAPVLDAAHPRWRELYTASAFHANHDVLSAHLELARQRLANLSAFQQALQGSPRGLIHGDYTPANVIYDQRRLSIIDWEKSCLGPWYSDLAQAIYYFVGACPEHATTIVQQLLIGYQAKRSFPEHHSLDAWLRLLPATILLIDASAAITEAATASDPRAHRRTAYLHDISLPRFAGFLAVENAVLDTLRRRNAVAPSDQYG